MYFSWSVKVTKIKLKEKKNLISFHLLYKQLLFLITSMTAATICSLQNSLHVCDPPPLLENIKPHFCVWTNVQWVLSRYARFMVGVARGKYLWTANPWLQEKKKSTDLVSSMKNKSSSSRKKECKKCYKERCCFSFEILTKSWIIWRQGGKRIKHRGKQFGLNYFFSRAIISYLFYD